ncbi:MAG: GNAT family N-acetyltransferase [Clostridia bacterium]|nr:GNAT family N-acetyltransferase [Clostridia bacterium]
MGLFSKTLIPLEPIETARLRIVPLTRGEFDAALRDPLRDEEFHAAMEELDERARHDSPARFAWYSNRMIYRKEDNVCIGSIACMNSPEKDPDKLGLVEIGYSTDEAFRCHGYMTEAVGALCDWILAQKKVYGVIAGVMDDNPASCRVLEKNGFVMTDHSETLSLQVWKKLPAGRRPITFFERIF